MPKLKTRRSAAKRFKRTGSGKLSRRKAYKNHLLEHKTTARKRRLSEKVLVCDCDVDNVLGMLPYV